MDSFETELVNRLVDFIKYDSYRANAIVNIEDDGSHSGGSSTESRLMVIGTAAFCGNPAFEMEESVQPTSVSIGYPTVESVTDIIEMEPVPTGVVERRVRFALDTESEAGAGTEGDVQMREELEDLFAAQQAGTAFILGHTHVRAKQGSSMWKKLAINIGYNFLRRNCRGADVALKVPPASLLEVGMVYVV